MRGSSSPPPTLTAREAKERPVTEPLLKSTELEKRIKEATELLSVAEREVDQALSGLTLFERADKKMIGDVLRAALSKLAAARGNLEAVLGQRQG
jgi:hypothetical protein